MVSFPHHEILIILFINIICTVSPVWNNTSSLVSGKLKKSKQVWLLLRLVYNLMKLNFSLFCFSRWRWCCRHPLCTRRRQLTCSHLQSALPTTTCTLCIWPPWLICCRSSCPLKVPKVWWENKNLTLFLWQQQMSKQGFPLCLDFPAVMGGEETEETVAAAELFSVVSQHTGRWEFTTFVNFLIC